MALNALVDSFLPQSEKCGAERVKLRPGAGLDYISTVQYCASIAAGESIMRKVQLLLYRCQYTETDRQPN